jgi:8-amino-7-oxononanoate synthase
MNYTTQHLPSRTLTTNNQEYLWFSGTSYLGMPHHQGFRENFIKAFAQYGTSWGSSRNNTIRLEIYEKAEVELAKFAQMPAALTVSSGMLAGQLVCNFLQKPDTPFFYAPKTHPALWHSASLSLQDWEKGLTYDDWSLKIAEKVKETKAQNIVICTDSVGSPYVECFDFQWINDLPKEKNITIVIDASHSFGVNHSIIQSSNRRTVNHSIIITSSLNKAMGMTGGAIFAGSEIIAEIRKLPMFSGASPMMPALLETFVNSVDYFHEQRQKLMENIAYFNAQMPKNTFLDSIENYPAYCTHQSGVHEFLKENGIMTACFPYPTASDLPVTRLVISALHLKEDLDKLIEVLKKM